MPSLPPKLVNRGPAGLISKDGGKLTNRGPAGLVSKAAAKPDAGRPQLQVRPPKGPVDRIRCAGEVIEIARLTPDPTNARVHPERNMETIEDSLNLYGQCSPITVKRDGMVVMKGNGTMEAARRLGWTKLACSVIDFEQVEAFGYGLADNRSAEHARWDFEVVARIERLMAEAGQQAVGWTLEELSVLRRLNQADAPDEFKEVGEDVEVDHVCPKCGYRFSGGETVERTR